MVVCQQPTSAWKGHRYHLISSEVAAGDDQYDGACIRDIFPQCSSSNDDGGIFAGIAALNNVKPQNVTAPENARRRTSAQSQDFCKTRATGEGNG